MPIPMWGISLGLFVPRRLPRGSCARSVRLNLRSAATFWARATPVGRICTPDLGLLSLRDRSRSFSPRGLTVFDEKPIRAPRCGDSALVTLSASSPCAKPRWLNARMAAGLRCKFPRQKHGEQTLNLGTSFNFVARPGWFHLARKSTRPSAKELVFCVSRLGVTTQKERSSVFGEVCHD